MSDNPHDATIKALEEAIKYLKSDNDRFARVRKIGTDEVLNWGIWWWDGGESEILSFVEHPRYADDYLDVPASTVDPYHIILIPARPDEVEVYDDED